jgi:hypothetical protein
MNPFCESVNLDSFDLWIGSLLLFALAGGIAIVLAAISPHVFD